MSETPRVDAVHIRPLREEDLERTERTSDAVFLAADAMSGGRTNRGRVWAIDVGLAARLAIGQEGYLALRRIKEPAPYLASGHFL